MLYVGMTRASERLVIAGVEPSGRLAENSWHVRVERALAALGRRAARTTRPGARRSRYRGAVTAAAVKPQAARVADRPAPPVPDWARRPAPAESRPPRPLAPSALAEDREAAPPPSAEQRAAARRGTLIHQLFERLPGVDAERPPAQSALRWLEHSAGIADAAEREALADARLRDHRRCRLSPPCSGRRRLPKRRSPRRSPTAASSPGPSTGCWSRTSQVSVIDFKTGRVPADARPISRPRTAPRCTAYAEALAGDFPGPRRFARPCFTPRGPRLFELGG